MIQVIQCLQVKLNYKVNESKILLQIFLNFNCGTIGTKTYAIASG